ncbi:pimeloyl-ACP methyl ester carboxylesterase [Ruminiclostridium sufflavum DSM 19573]|uniref:Pimeloyl-ACP methyl ester carboxylesterase n=1 Tax=Ruminiclostridium sufflavum DSM 19573 TaxID=1121337 RepID=A0A318XKR5_9FIRM|nr:alpha/beta hydrolase [Ruminiclostridium sufflavum]PYG88035.1 pimeloyl-ACP methyl ester carboxylesterase [Ruminiclostridium sufflavum DSM 19573]
MKFRKMIKFLVCIIVLCFLGCIIYHFIMLNKEKELMTPLGTLVTVNGHKMSVYFEGEGDKTLVFMSGSGTSSPILDFKSLGSCLSDKYKIAIVEKFGYGFSDVSGGTRDIETILSETREALIQAGVTGPYILCPHSMSGIEALYWQQQYPDEVEAIIGLDMAVKDTYKNFEPSTVTLTLGALAAKLGITRLLPDAAESDAIKYGNLTEQEKKIYRAVFYRRTATKDMINEVKAVKENAAKLCSPADITVPVLLFGSNGKGTGFNDNYWCSCQQEFMKQIQNGTFIQLDCSHYVQDIEYKKIAASVKKFISETL